ncbi:sterol 3-beta-glucosyltransferase [Scheffersomyces xylosifermentans]|uniref:sterol 3-beta-glucosyltransferase n=1 Tax=Scheffersomyces xylosifermentans TaxID=1304137 RepID=UPI00315CB273
MSNSPSYGESDTDRGDVSTIASFKSAQGEETTEVQPQLTSIKESSKVSLPETYSSDTKKSKVPELNPETIITNQERPGLERNASTISSDLVQKNTLGSATTLVTKRTTFQQSILDNLDPSLIKKGLLVKLKGEQGGHHDAEKLRLSIADKLQKVFDLSDDDYFYGNYSSWLIKDVLLQGHLYLTRECILFFAFLPKRYSVHSNSEDNFDDSNNIIQSGTLGMKTAKYGDSLFTTVLTHRYWAILRPETLSIYSSSTDLYFPHSVIDLKSCIRAEIVDKDKSEIVKSSPPKTGSFSGTGANTPRYHRDSNEMSDEEMEYSNVLAQEATAVTEDNAEGISGGVWVRVLSKKKTYKFYCDSLFSARQWCNNITKLIFQLNNTNEGDEVLIKIPIENVVDFGKNSIFDMQGVDIRGMEDEIPLCLSILKLMGFDVGRKKTQDGKTPTIHDFAIESIYFLFFRDGFDCLEKIKQIVQDHKKYSDDHTDLSKRKSKSDNPPRSISPTLTSISGGIAMKRLGRSLSSPAKIFSSKKSLAESPTSCTRSISDFTELDSPGSELSLSPSQQLSFPKPLTIAGLKNMQMSFETSHREVDLEASRYKQGDVTNSRRTSISNPSEYNGDGKQTKLNAIGKSIKALSNVSNKWSAFPAHFVESGPDDPYYVKDKTIRESTERHYQEHFSLNSEKKLIGTYYAHLQRSIPVYGKVYLGDTILCFRSLLPGVSTKMILPLTEIETCYREKGLKLTYSGLVIVVHGQDELFLEFSSQKARDDCESMLLCELEKLHGNETWAPSPHQWGPNYELELSKTRLMNGFDNTTVPSWSESDLKIANMKIAHARIKMFEDKLNAAAGLDIPIILEDSPIFKTEVRPSTSYNFTLLTIGSRGDVQPYIALGKGLMKEGHNVTIATHAEFEDWIVKHGMKFKVISGNPAELMSLMVTHGSMSVAFLKEASSKFRGWITELLTSSWEACQGTDILIESPSSMGGVHIAEALGIPYLRAFTMPWTRTRAYPHAFIVPESGKGGSYNYLTHVMFETVFWKGISGQINKWRVKELGLPRTNLFRMQQTKIPFMYNVSPTIFPPAVDFPDWVKVTGYWFLDEGAAEDYDPPEELLEFIEEATLEGKKIVYIGFGSIVVKDARSLTTAIVNAVLDADVRCILNKGWSDRLTKDKTQPEIELPPEIYNSGAIPHDWLFPKIDAAVHHGGSGTTGATLRAGLPTIIKPFFGDQFFYANRVEEIGAGIGLKKLNAKSLSKALITVISDLKIIEKSKKISEKIRRENGVSTAIETIYSELEYARNLIAAKQQHNENYRLHHQPLSGMQTPASHDSDSEEYTDDEDEDEFDEDDSDEDGSGEDTDDDNDSEDDTDSERIAPEPAKTEEKEEEDSEEDMDLASPAQGL